MAKVYSRNASGNFTRLEFDGLEEDARKHIVDNFPRLHIEPGSHDEPEASAKLVVNDGDDPIHWDGQRWSDEVVSDHDDDKV